MTKSNSLDDAKVAELADALALGYSYPQIPRFLLDDKNLAIDPDKTKVPVSAFLGTLSLSVRLSVTTRPEGA